MQQIRNMAVMALTLFGFGLLAETTAAHARGGASSIMNSPGYQRRLQESRGYVTNQSGSLFSAPAEAAPPVIVKPKRRHRH